MEKSTRDERAGESAATTAPATSAAAPPPESSSTSAATEAAVDTTAHPAAAKVGGDHLEVEIEKDDVLISPNGNYIRVSTQRILDYFSNVPLIHMQLDFSFPVTKVRINEASF